MSLTIDTNGLKFVIFASGHDYTLADSGDGDVQIFSHPFVPKGSKNYAGQYYFIVPDENGDALDAVKDDVAHCTFTPAIGTTFSTAGETTVSVHYHREYIHDEETIVVDKTVSQKIMVVNHGSLADQTTNLDVYADGYGFIRPVNVNTIEEKDYHIAQKDAVTKLSSIPWRATGLGEGTIYGFFKSENLTDISELAFADISRVTKFVNLFKGDRSLSDISAVENWDVSKVEYMIDCFGYTNITSLEALKKWNVSQCTELEQTFASYIGTTLHGLENWNVSNVTNMRQIFDHCENLTDATAISNWDVSKVERLDYAFSATLLTDTNAFALWDVSSLINMQGIFKASKELVDLAGLSNWQDDVVDISEAFEDCTSLTDLSGIHGLNVASVTDFSSVFAFCTYITTLDGLEAWDVSSGEAFRRMFKGCPWIADISAIANWDMTNAQDLFEMFDGDAWITDLADLVNWRLPNATNLGGMLKDGRGCYSSLIGKRLWYNAYYYYDYEDHQYINGNVEDIDHPLSYPTYNAIGATNWKASGTGYDAFDSHWINIPAWN